MRALQAALAASFLLLQASTATAQAERANVEGYVYNKFTRVPVSGAWVTLTTFGPITGHSGPDTIVVASTMSDGNGFYSLSSDSYAVQRGTTGAQIQATCYTPRGPKTSSSWAKSVQARPGIIERDLFIEGLSKKLVVPKCGFVGPITIPGVQPTPGTPSPLFNLTR